MKKKNNKLIYGAVGGIIIIAIIMFNPDFDEISLGFNLGDSDAYTYEIALPTTLAFSTNQVFGIQCLNKVELFQQFTDGTIRSVSNSAFDTEIPTLSLNSRTIGKEIKTFIVELRGKCVKTNTAVPDDLLGFQLIRSPVTMAVSTVDWDGRGKAFTPSQKLTGDKIPMINNKEKLFVTWTFSAKSLEDVYSPATQIWKAQVKIDIVGDLKYTYATAGGAEYHVKADFGDLRVSSYYNVKKIIDTTPNVTFRNSVIHIESIAQTISGKSLTTGSFKLDTTLSQGRQIKVIGLVRDWQQSEGNPNIAVITPKGSQAVTSIMNFDKTINSGDDALFKWLYTMPSGSIEGEWKVRMTLQGRSMTSTNSFWVDNSEGEPTKVGCTVNCDPEDPTQNVDFDVPIEKAEQGLKVLIFYKATFSDDTKSGLIESNPISVIAKELSIVNELGGSPSKLIDIEITPQLQFPDAETVCKFKTIDSDIDFTTRIIIDTSPPQTISLAPSPQTLFTPQSPACIGQGSATISASPKNLLPLGLWVLKASEIDSALSNIKIKESPIEIIVEIKGSFKIKDENAKIFEGFMSGAKFKWPAVYSTLKFPGETENKDIKCGSEQYADLKINSDGSKTVICRDNETDEEEEPECPFLDKCVDITNEDNCENTDSSMCEVEDEETLDDNNNIPPPDPSQEGDVNIGGNPSGDEGLAIFCKGIGQVLCAQALDNLLENIGLSDDEILFYGAIGIILMIVIIAVAFSRRQQY